MTEQNGTTERNGSETAIVPVSSADLANFNADDPVSVYLNSGIFAQLQRVAHLMASSQLVPGHLRGTERRADCFLVVAQAFRWRMDPFAVAQHTFVVKGKLGYEGKLVAGVVNASGKLESSLSYAYSGEGPGRRVVVSGRLKGEAAPRTVDGKVSSWRTENENWQANPDQMLAYRGAREWARRHMPEAVLGIRADEEIDLGEDGPAPADAPASTLAGVTDKLKAEAENRAREEALLARIESLTDDGPARADLLKEVTAARAGGGGIEAAEKWLDEHPVFGKDAPPEPEKPKGSKKPRKPLEE